MGRIWQLTDEAEAFGLKAGVQCIPEASPWVTRRLACQKLENQTELIFIQSSYKSQDDDWFGTG